MDSETTLLISIAAIVVPITCTIFCGLIAYGHRKSTEVLLQKIDFTEKTLLAKIRVSNRWIDSIEKRAIEHYQHCELIDKGELQRNIQSQGAEISRLRGFRQWVTHCMILAGRGLELPFPEPPKD